MMCSYDNNRSFNECDSLCTEWSLDSGTNNNNPCAGFQTSATRMNPEAPGECQLIKGNQNFRLPLNFGLEISKNNKVF